MTHGKKLRFCPGLKDSKMITPARGGEVASTLSSRQRVLLLPLLLLTPFIFQKRLLFSRRTFLISLKYPIVFQKCPLVLQKCLHFIYCERLFSRMLFFPADSTFSLFSSELLREVIFALLFCFLLELFIDQFMSYILLMFTLNQ